MEDWQYEIANRLLQRGMRAGDRRAFHLCTARLPLGRSESIPDLERLIQPVHPALMVIDTAREALGISDWCNPAEVVEKIRPLREFARAHCSILLIAHNRKAEGEGGDEISGTNAFTSSIDGWLSCFKREVLANGNLRLSIRREGRCGMRGEFVVEMDTRTLRFTALTEEQLSEARPDAHQERYLSVLHLMAQNDNRATAIMISERLEIDLRLAQRVLKEMASRQWICDNGERAGDTGRAIVYELTEEGKWETRQRDNATKP